MNILTDALPESVRIGADTVAIATDFRAGLRVILAFEDPELTDLEKQMILLQVMYGDTEITDTEAAAHVAVKFLDGGKRESADQGNPSPRVMSWQIDQQLIYAAFRQTHGIDLTTATLHWWQFLALFMDLGADTAFCQLAAQRQRLKDGSASKEEKKAAAKNPGLYYLPEPDHHTNSQRQTADEFLRLVKANEERG